MDLNNGTLLELADRISGASGSARMTDSNIMNEKAPTFAHSRNSSTESSVSSPFPSVFSSRTHSRWPSSASSLNTTPDSPPVLAKSALHDLLEEPAERENELDLSAEVDALDGFCLCDSIFCEHRRISSVPDTPLESPWASIDRAFDLPDSAVGPPSDRRSSDGSSRGGDSTQHSRRFPSISRRWRRRKTTSSISASMTAARSAPPSRSPSFRNLNWANSFVSHLQSPRFDAVPESLGGGSNFESHHEPDILDDPFFLGLAKESLDQEQERSTTPLLPFLASPLRLDGRAEPKSILPSPSIPAQGTTDSQLNSPTSRPTSPGLWSSTLSTKPSATSIRTGFSLHGADIPPSSPTNRNDFDKWAIKLGHANFHISPEPYLPNPLGSTETCQRLRQDWEVARIAFMRHAALIAEHYGLASRTYALTCEKWEEVDSQWRVNFEKVRAEVEECHGDVAAATTAAGVQSPDLRALPETQAVLQMPLLNEEKFPAVDAADFVGPMVRYDTIQPPQQQQHADASAKKGGLLRLITDPTSLLRKS